MKNKYYCMLILKKDTVSESASYAVRDVSFEEALNIALRRFTLRLNDLTNFFGRDIIKYTTSIRDNKIYFCIPTNLINKYTMEDCYVIGKECKDTI
jgi:hypothetical protein